MTDDLPPCTLWHCATLADSADAPAELAPLPAKARTPAGCASRRAWLRRTLALGTGAAMLAGGLACGRLLAAGAVSGAAVDLKTMLEKGLRVKRPADAQYVDHVVARVNDGTLPSSLVKSSFLWARNKRPYPFVYFRQALEQQAKKRGISI